MEGYQKRLEMTWQLQAWGAMHNYAANGAGKKTPTVDRLLGGAFTRRRRTAKPVED